MRKIITIMGIAGAILATGFAAHAGETLDRVMEKKAMVVATNAGWPPQSFLDDSNQLVDSTLTLPMRSASVWASPYPSRHRTGQP